MKIPKNYLKQKISGIYCIENTINKKRYIGSSKDIYYRWHRHRSDLRKNKHQNQILQNSFNKNKEENFVFYLLEKCEEKHLLNKEQEWIDNLSPEYNITLKVERNNLSKSSKDKISKTLKEKYNSGEIVSLSKKSIDVYLLNGVFLKNFDSCKEASIELNISESSITSVLNKKYKQIKGFVIVNKGECFMYNKEEKLGVSIRLIKNNIEYEFRSFSEAARYLNSPISCIHRAFKNNKNYKGYEIIKITYPTIKSDELLERP